VLPVAAGIGLRHAHHRRFVAGDVPVATGFVEVHSENFFGDGGRDLDLLHRVRADHAVSLHGVGLSLGSADGLDAGHLDRLARLVERIAPQAVSDHLCWGGFDGAHWNDLLPLPTTAEALAVTSANVARVQDRLKRPILVENISAYVRFAGRSALDDALAEVDFVARLVARTGCGLLLDLNNVQVNAFNHGFDAATVVDAMPVDAVHELHLAGHLVRDDGVVIDHHGDRVSAAVWALHERFVARAGPRPTLIEWDTDVPALEVLLDEAARAQRVLDAHAAPRALHTSRETADV
jgi:uncharacterized protein (UPF0276 family)